jgi:chorismate mutase
MSRIVSLRAKIDEVDRQIVELIALRLESAVEIGKIKREAGLPLCDFNREAEVLANVREAARRTGMLPEKDISRLFLVVMEISMNAQKVQPVPEYGRREP